MKEEGDRREGWHVGKEIPLAIIFAIAVQTMGAIWWAATLSAKLDDLSYQVASINADKYTKTDAEKDQKYFNQRQTDVERRITNLENQHGRH